jgi:DNA-binding transcriptional MerR regulator
MKIGELSQLSGVATKTIRYYEEIGVLPDPLRTANGYRAYKQESVERLRFIRDAQSTGLTLTEIASILELREQGASTCGHVTSLLQQHLQDLDQYIATLQRTRTQLAGLTERAQRLDPAQCTDVHRCQTIARDPATLDGIAVPQPKRHRHSQRT